MISILFLLLFSWAFQATAEELRDPSYPEVKTYYGMAQYVYQVLYMEQIPNGFDSGFFNSHLIRKDILNLIDPENTNTYWSLVGMKAWPNKPNVYIVTACTSKIPIVENHFSNNDDNCIYETDPRDKIIVTQVYYDGKNKPTLIANPWVEKLQWQHNPNTESDFANTWIEDFNVVDNDDFYMWNIENKSLKNSAFVVGNNPWANSWGYSLGNFGTLDFAPFHLNTETTAFGIRFNKIFRKGARGKSDQSITLFADIQGKTKPILTVPIHSYGEYYNFNSQKEEDEVTIDSDETNYTLIMLNQQTHGFNDIQLKQIAKGKQKSKIYQWNPHLQQYQCDCH